MSDADVLHIHPPADPERRTKPKLKKLRLLLVLGPLALLALVSTVFGMMMAVASDLPDLDTAREFQAAHNSRLYDVRNRPIGFLTSETNRIIVPYDGIAPVMRSAIIAIEDKRFYENAGVDLRGIARAFFQDVVQKRAAQGGSTIAQQFVKNALQAQAKRTIFQKLREAALAYHLTRRWKKEKILTQYLNSIYFGNGAYGIESAARTYFGADINHLGCGTAARPCAKELQPHEAALLAGLVANPTAFDPVVHPQAALRRRNLVLENMVAQGRLTPQEGKAAEVEALPGEIRQPQVRTAAPYFTTWIRQQIVDRYGAARAFEGGLRIRTTLDMDLQHAAETAAQDYLPLGGPSAAIVAIDNKSGEVRAMVGGRDYTTSPFNLATQGQRQPGSSFKPFILAEALTQGIGPGSVWPSRRRFFTVPGTRGREQFVVNNFEDSYVGQRTLADALTHSDNSVYAAVGIKVGTGKVARLARRMGIRTPVSSNYAMTLGGLKEGVTPLDMAHAYETIADGGNKMTGTLSAPGHGPVGIRLVKAIDNTPLRNGRNDPKAIRELSPAVAATMRQIMATVVTSGTGRRAATGHFAAGKTGTTENYGDAWFVGFDDRFTVAVWVGYPSGLRPMAHDFRGGPVEGGTFPALIWHDFVVKAEAIIAQRAAEKRAADGLPPTDTTATQPVTPTTTAPATGATTAPADTTGTAVPETAKKAPKPKAPKTPAPEPAPTPTTPPVGVNGGTGGAPPAG